MSTPNNEIKTIPLLSQTQITRERKYEQQFHLYRKGLLADRQTELKFLSMVEDTYNEFPTTTTKLNRSIARAQVSCETHILNGNKLLAEQQLSRLRDKMFIMLDELEDKPETHVNLTNSYKTLYDGTKHEENIRQVGGAMMRQLNTLQNFISILL